MIADTIVNPSHFDPRSVQMDHKVWSITWKIMSQVFCAIETLYSPERKPTTATKWATLSD